MSSENKERIVAKSIVDTIDNALNITTQGLIGIRYVGIEEGEWGVDFEYTLGNSGEYWNGISKGQSGYISLRVGKQGK